MATLTIKNLPDELYARLKAQARHHRRSINSEAIVCLERILQAAPLDPEALIAEAEELHHKLGRDLDPGIIEEAKRERDARGPR